MQLSNQLLQVVDDRKITRKLPVLSHLNDKIQLLKKLATSHFEKLYLTKEIEEEDITFEYTSLTLDFFIDDSMKKGFKDMFSSSLDMFQFFQLLYELNNNFLETSNRDGGIKTEVYKSAGFYTDGKLPVPGPNDRVFFFLDFLIEKQINGCKETKDLLLREFSDGEHQFLHTMCICLLLKDKRTILLLDEPETHFNPDWRSKFINVLGKSLKAGGSTNLMKDILLTSHSPFIISDCLPNNVFVFRKEANELIVKKAKELNFNTYGASVDLVLQVIFQMDYSISKTALEEIRVLLRKRKPSLIVEGAKKLGESYEKGFLYERIEKLKSRNNN
jgi:restriction system-associated AAA family ATPase